MSGDTGEQGCPLLFINPTKAFCNTVVQGTNEEKKQKARQMCAVATEERPKRHTKVNPNRFYPRAKLSPPHPSVI